MVNLMIKNKNKPFLAYKEPWMQENGVNKFHTLVSFFVGNPVLQLAVWFFVKWAGLDLDFEQWSCIATLYLSLYMDSDPQPL